MRKVENLIQNVGIERKLFLDLLNDISEARAQWKPKLEDWNIVEITEHLYWAEQGGILGMWKTIHAIREGKIQRTLESCHRDMSIDQIIDLTWQAKEIVPAVAAPRLGGPVYFWIASLNGLQDILTAFGADLLDDELRVQAHPHPISGAMDFQQRLEFLSFHLARHRGQVSRLLTEMANK